MNEISVTRRAVLHLRLEPDLDAMLDRVARDRGKARVEIARIALRSYLEKNDTVFRLEFQRQLATLPVPTPEEAEWLEAMTGDILKTLDEEDGGYDWGQEGPPK